MGRDRRECAIGYLLGLALGREGAAPPDAELLERFVARQDAAAFAALVRRHGPMVLGVCRRVLGNEADAEDAFQATFLVLVRRAASVVPASGVGNWLYGVARNTSLKAKSSNRRRRAREREAAEQRPPEAAEVWPQLQTELDEELSRLPEKYRTPIVLCDLEGTSIREAARRLGWPQGTVASRLARGRVMLAKRLARRGLALSGGALAALLSHGAASAALPAALGASTVEAATLLAGGGALTAEVIPARVIALTDGVMKAMFTAKLKSTAAALLALVLVLLAGSGLVLSIRAADKPADTKWFKDATLKNAEDEQFKKTLLDLETSFWEAHSRHDAGAIERLYADDYVCFSLRGRSDKAGNVQATKDYRSAELGISDVEIVRVRKDVGIVTYKLRSRVLTKEGHLIGEAHRRLSNCWARREGGWVLVFSQEIDLPGGK
jgi:RNA polymerase sigma factor (sigma-70 family)